MKEVFNKSIKEVEKEERNETNKKNKYIYFDYFGDTPSITEEEIQNQKKLFNTKKEIVKFVLEGYEEARNYDTVMELECLRMEFPSIEVTSGKDNIIFKFPKKEINAIIKTPFEDYRRARQKLIEDAIKRNDTKELMLLLPTNPKIRERRIRKRRLLQEYFKRVK